MPSVPSCADAAMLHIGSRSSAPMSRKIHARRPPPFFNCEFTSIVFVMVSSLLHEKCVGIRTVNRRMAQRASRIFLALVVECGDAGRACPLGQRVTFEAKQIDLRPLQKPRVS